MAINYIKISLTNYPMIQKMIILDLTINAMKGNSDSDYTNEMFISDLKKTRKHFCS